MRSRACLSIDLPTSTTTLQSFKKLLVSTQFYTRLCLSLVWWRRGGGRWMNVCNIIFRQSGGMHTCFSLSPRLFLSWGLGLHLKYLYFARCYDLYICKGPHAQASSMLNTHAMPSHTMLGSTDQLVPKYAVQSYNVYSLYSSRKGEGGEAAHFTSDQIQTQEFS